MFQVAFCFCVGCLFVEPAAQIIQCQARECLDPFGIGIEAGDVVVLRAAGFVELLSAGDGDFFHGFEAVADEAGAENIQLLHTVAGKAVQQFLGARAYPFGFAELALEGNNIMLFA